jgi:radical SAM superfamily enzyme YgiQ (UPF0313 family)
MEGSGKEYDAYLEKLRFAYHQLARTCKNEREFTDALLMISILPGTPEYDEAKRAWQRFRRAKRDTP